MNCQCGILINLALIEVVAKHAANNESHTSSEIVRRFTMNTT